MYAGQRDFLEACPGNSLDFGEHVLDRNAPRPAARRRNDAVGARLGAAGLDAERERSAAGDARFDGRAARAEL